MIQIDQDLLKMLAVAWCISAGGFVEHDPGAGRLLHQIGPGIRVVLASEPTGKTLDHLEVDRVLTQPSHQDGGELFGPGFDEVGVGQPRHDQAVIAMLILGVAEVAWTNQFQPLRLGGGPIRHDHCAYRYDDTDSFANELTALVENPHLLKEYSLTGGILSKLAVSYDRQARRGSLL